MSTITNDYPHAPSLGLRERYRKLLDWLEFSYFALISFTITLGSIFGGAMLMFTFEYNAPLWEPITGMILSLANNVVAIAQGPVKWILPLFVLTILANGVLILVNAL